MKHDKKSESTAELNQTLKVRFQTVFESSSCVVSDTRERLTDARSNDKECSVPIFGPRSLYSGIASVGRA